jgi:hypothetical protein
VSEDEVHDVSVNSHDVTDQFVDAAARAASLEATHSQLLALMKRADSVKDVLAVQRQQVPMFSHTRALFIVGRAMQAVCDRGTRSWAVSGK